MRTCQSLCLLLAFLSAAFSVSSACAEVGGFQESFSGDFRSDPLWGSYDGFDNPGWRVGLVDGGVGESGLQVITESNTRELGVVVNRVVRDVVGVGSFVERIELNDINLAALTFPSVGFFELSHSMVEFPTIGSVMSFRLREPGDFEEGVSDGLWNLEVNSRVAGSLGEAYVEEVSSEGVRDVALEIRYSHLSKVATFYFDNLLDDDGPMVVGPPVPWSGAFNETHYSQLVTQAAGFGTANAFVREWSVFPVNAYDFDMDLQLGSGDLQLLVEALRAGDFDAAFDVNEDNQLDNQDLSTWVHDLANTYFGDANLDGEFSSSDLVNVFVAGEYEAAL